MNARSTLAIGTLLATSLMNTAAFAEAVVSPYEGTSILHTDTQTPREFLRILVKPKPDFYEAAFLDFMRSLGADLIDHQAKIGVWRFCIPEALVSAILERLRNHPQIEFVEPDQALTPAQTMSSPEALPKNTSAEFPPKPVQIVKISLHGEKELFLVDNNIILCYH